MFKKQPKSVDGILTVFNKAISDLQEVEIAHEITIANNTEAIKQLEENTKQAHTEKQRASSVMMKLKDLTSM